MPTEPGFAVRAVIEVIIPSRLSRFIKVPKMKETIHLNAIHDKDLEPLLREHQLDAPLAEGKVRCHSCAQPMTWDSIGGIAFKEGRLVLYCEAMECMHGGRNRQYA